MSNHLIYTAPRKLSKIREPHPQCVECGQQAEYRKRVNLLDPKTGSDTWIYACAEHRHTEMIS